MDYDVIIGLEIHCQLKTKSKMFCSCPNLIANSLPNTNVCPICLGHPGTLPVLNEQALKDGLLLGLALNCKINQLSKFDRKNYFYPDLPKGYQISQYDLPIADHGYLNIEANRDIGITRIHLEEDTGKLIHDKSGHSLIDYNRAGAPLLELVTEPVLTNAEEAKKFCQHFQRILRYLKISDANMDQGEMRCEANVSLQQRDRWQYQDGHIKPLDDYRLNSKVEVKNINSFRALEKAINYEIKRQQQLLDKGEAISHETRGWNEAEKKTVAQRTKETSADYRYFPEPDLPPLTISEELLAEIRSGIVELPQEKIDRFRSEYNLSQQDAEVLAGDWELAAYAEKVFSELRAWIEAAGDDWQRQKTRLSKIAANWLISELLKHLHLNNHSIRDVKITPENFAELVALIFEEKISSSAGQIILNQMYQVGGDPSDIMARQGLEQLSDDSTLQSVTERMLEENSVQAEQYRQGKTTVLQYLIGKMMAASSGKANPKKVKELIEKLLNK